MQFSPCAKNPHVQNSGPLSIVRPSLTLLALLLTGFILHAQQAQPNQQAQPAPQDQQETTTIKKDVNVVNVLATVRNKQGQIVTTLTKDDFKLEDDGKLQTIRYFAKVTDLPLTLGLLVDTSVSQRRVLEQERTASYTFLEQLLREWKDKAFVVHFDMEIELLQDLTNSRPKLEAALQKLEVPNMRQAQTGGSNDPSQPQWGGGGTKLYDAIFLASDEITAKQQGRKALIILSDGVDQGSKVSLSRAIEAAQRSDTLVYTILFADPQAYNNVAGGYPGGHHGGMGYPGGGYPGGGYPGGGRHGGGYPGGGYPGGGYPGGSGGGGNPGGGGRTSHGHADGKQVMQQLAQQTGGRFYEVSKHESIEQIYASIGEELRNQYSLGFTPDRAQADEGYHKILLTTTQKDLTVQARDGYYSGK
jgi:VWFA-related protein